MVLSADARDVVNEAAVSPLFSGNWRIVRPSALAPWAAALSCVLFCFNGELLQSLQINSSPGEGHASVLLNLTLCHLGGLLFFPYFGWGTNTATRHGEASPRVASPITPGGTGLRCQLASSPRLTALLFSFLLMGYNYAWLSSAKFLAVGLTNSIFQVSVALVYAASVPLFSEPVTWSRFLGVFMAIAGSAIASGALNSTADLSSKGSGFGICLALLAACGYTVYQVLFRYVFGHLKQDVSFLAYFASWVGVWHVTVILPLVVMADVFGVEKLEFPTGSRAIIATFASAGIASAVNALYLCIVLWGTPMMLPSVSALSVPLTVLLDFILHQRRPARSEFIGQCMLLMSVVLIMQLHTTVMPKKSQWHDKPVEV
eukprot:TRINITY_DN15159_c1_g2_i1.p1 TRINITY_DN15159_c1_g2~~TRINITY_DN15159_c1_g2_i1.p1  ORF type:complete len:373 (+),score=31.18 TRINITY_DN15159_c1_g2_i1:105-1223(+)